MEIGEMVAVIVTVEKKEDCWYCKEKKKKDEHISKLERGYVAGWRNTVEKKTSLSWYEKPVYGAMCAEAHHLIPVKSMNRIEDLHKFIEKSKGKIDDDIGYDINHPNNSIWLPGRPVPSSETHKQDLIKEAKSQIHNSPHPDYRSNIRSILTEILTKINKKKPPGACPICGEKMNSKMKAPYGLVSRLDAVSRKMKTLLKGNPKEWLLDEGYYTFSRSLKEEVKTWIKANKI